MKTQYLYVRTPSPKKCCIINPTIPPPPLNRYQGQTQYKVAPQGNKNLKRRGVHDTAVSILKRMFSKWFKIESLISHRSVSALVSTKK